MNVEQVAGRGTRLEDEVKRLEVLLSRHDRSWLGFMSKILQARGNQIHDFLRDLGSGNQMIMCGICMDHIPKSRIPNSKITDRCDHATTACLECLSKSLSSQLDSTTWDRVSCPICPVVLGFEEVEMYASKDVTARYQRFMIADTVKNEPEYRQCIRPGCNYGQLHQDGEKAPLVRYGECKFRMCYVHNIPWHENQTCSEYDYNLGRGEDKKREEEASQNVANAVMNSVGNALHHMNVYVIMEMGNTVGTVPITAPTFRLQVLLYGHRGRRARIQGCDIIGCLKESPNLREYKSFKRGAWWKSSLMANSCGIDWETELKLEMEREMEME
ncbi:hypothetical protein MMC11_001031 [Xylographa trunciseda]|nr:hypothetical protein [Xylographa trunciseda]